MSEGLVEAIADALRDVPVECWWHPSGDGSTDHATLTAESALLVAQTAVAVLAAHPGSSGGSE